MTDLKENFAPPSLTFCPNFGPPTQLCVKNKILETLMVRGRDARHIRTKNVATWYFFVNKIGYYLGVVITPRVRRTAMVHACTQLKLRHTALIPV